MDKKMKRGEREFRGEGENGVYGDLLPKSQPHRIYGDQSVADSVQYLGDRLYSHKSHPPI